MKKLIKICLVMFWLLSPAALAGADECAELHGLAMSYVESAREVYNADTDYEHAAELFCEAAGYFELINQRSDCANREIWAASRGKADYYLDRSFEAENMVRYLKAVKLYQQGNELARNRDWDRALSRFAEAAQLWQTVSALEPNGENGKRARKAARHAENVMARARRFRESLETGEW